MKGVNIRYSADELAWLESNRTLPISEYAAGFNEAFGRDVSATNLHALRKRRGWKTGRTGCFAKGQEPFNKGKPCAPGVGGRHPNARKTQFKAGALSGKARANYKPVGTERITEDGYRERKIHDGLPARSRWKLVHVIEWEAVHGPVPEGHCLKCRDADRTNTDPANWQLIPRALLARLNGGRFKKHLAHDEAAPELRPALIAIARLDHRAREMRRGRTAAPLSVAARMAEDGPGRDNQ